MGIIKKMMLLLCALLARAEASPFQEKEVNYKGNKFLVRSFGKSAIEVKGKDYSVYYQQIDPLKMPHEIWFESKKIEAKLYNLSRGKFKNLLVTSIKANALKELYYELSNDGRYHLKKKLGRPLFVLKDANAVNQNCETKPPEDRNLQTLIAQISGLSDSDRKQWISLHENFSQSCNTNKPMLVNAVSEILGSKDGNNYLGCLSQHRLSPLADLLVERLADPKTKKPDLSFECQDGPILHDPGSHEQIEGTYDEKNGNITISTQDPQLPSSLFHELIHSAGVVDEDETHSIEDCCSKISSRESEACKSLDTIVSDETLGHYYLNAFKTKLTGFDDVWDKFSGKSTTVGRKAFLAFAREIDKNGPKILAGRKVCEAEPQTIPPRDCLEETKANIIKLTTDTTDRICSHEAFQGDEGALCNQLKANLAKLVADNLSSNCSDEKGNQIPCVTSAFLEAHTQVLASQTDPAYQRDLTIPFKNEIYESFSGAKDSYIGELIKKMDTSPQSHVLAKSIEDFGKKSKNLTRYNDQIKNLKLRYFSFLTRLVSERGQDISIDPAIIDEFNQKYFPLLCLNAFTGESFSVVDQECKTLGDEIGQFWDQTCVGDQQFKATCLANYFEDAEKTADANKSTKYDHIPTQSAVACAYENQVKSITNPNGKQFYAEIESQKDIDTESADDLLRTYLESLRAIHTTAETDALSHWESCKDSSDLAKCGSDSLKLFQKTTSDFFNGFCHQYYTTKLCKDTETKTESFVDKFLKNCPDQKSGGMSCLADMFKRAENAIVNDQLSSITCSSPEKNKLSIAPSSLNEANQKPIAISGAPPAIEPIDSSLAAARGGENWNGYFGKLPDIWSPTAAYAANPTGGNASSTEFNGSSGQTATRANISAAAAPTPTPYADSALSAQSASANLGNQNGSPSGASTEQATAPGSADPSGASTPTNAGAPKLTADPTTGRGQPDASSASPGIGSSGGGVGGQGPIANSNSTPGHSNALNADATSNYWDNWDSLRNYAQGNTAKFKQELTGNTALQKSLGTLGIHVLISPQEQYGPSENARYHLQYRPEQNGEPETFIGTESL